MRNYWNTTSTAFFFSTCIVPFTLILFFHLYRFLDSVLFYHAFAFLPHFSSHGYWLACGVAHYRWCKVEETRRTVSFKSNYSRTPTFIWPRRNSYLTKYVLKLLGCHSNNWRQEDIWPHEDKCRSRWKPVHARLKLNWGKRECDKCTVQVQNII